MKKYFLFVLAVGFIASCSKDEESLNNSSSTELIGTWNLIENYSDPGDGSGSFESVDSDKTITFNDDRTVTSNGDMCSMSPETDGPTAGAYSLRDSTLTDCHFDYGPLTFQQNGNILVLNYPCIEPCKAKYAKE